MNISPIKNQSLLIAAIVAISCLLLTNPANKKANAPSLTPKPPGAITTNIPSTAARENEHPIIGEYRLGTILLAIKKNPIDQLNQVINIQLNKKKERELKNGFSNFLKKLFFLKPNNNRISFLKINIKEIHNIDII